MIFTSPDHAKINVAEPHKYSYSIPLRRVDCKIPEKNVLTLELCRYKTDKMTDFSEKAIAIERVVERLKREDYEGNVSLRFSFYSDFRPKGLKLVLEDAEEYSIRFNGKEISNESKEFYYSSAFKLVDLPDLTLIGENVIEITRYTKPQKALEPSDDMKHLFELFRAPVGVDMERIHLVGDFLVDTIPEYSATAGAVRLGKQFFIKEQKAITPATDVTSCGYPFYPGALEYTIKFKLTEKEMSCERILFKIGNYSGCTSAVYLNGEKAGFIDKDPYSLVLNKNLFTKSGENEIQVRLLGTFRNMLGYSHFVECDPSGCSRITWYFGYEFTDCTEYDTGNLTNSLQLTPYGLGSFSLELEMTEI